MCSGSIHTVACVRAALLLLFLSVLPLQEHMGGCALHGHLGGCALQEHLGGCALHGHLGGCALRGQGRSGGFALHGHLGGSGLWLLCAMGLWALLCCRSVRVGAFAFLLGRGPWSGMAASDSGAVRLSEEPQDSATVPTCAMRGLRRVPVSPSARRLSG